MPRDEGWERTSSRITTNGVEPFFVNTEVLDRTNVTYPDPVPCASPFRCTYVCE